jgi:RNAse (barnase) inhibitor barstar
MNNFILINKDINTLDRKSYSVRIDGSKVLSLDDAYFEIAKAFKFPSYFSFNRDSFFVCLNDLEGLNIYEEYNLIIKNYNSFLSKESKATLKGFLEDLI